MINRLLGMFLSFSLLSLAACGSEDEEARSDIRRIESRLDKLEGRESSPPSDKSGLPELKTAAEKYKKLEDETRAFLVHFAKLTANPREMAVHWIAKLNGSGVRSNADYVGSAVTYGLKYADWESESELHADTVFTAWRMFIFQGGGKRVRDLYTTTKDTLLPTAAKYKVLLLANRRILERPYDHSKVLLAGGPDAIMECRFETVPDRERREQCKQVVADLKAAFGSELTPSEVWLLAFLARRHAEGGEELVTAIQEVARDLIAEVEKGAPKPQ